MFYCIFIALYRKTTGRRIAKLIREAINIMQGKFLQGVFWGGIMGAVVAMNWDKLAQKCPIMNELKKFVGDEQSDCHCSSHNHEHKSRNKSRKYIQARSHRILKDL